MAADQTQTENKGASLPKPRARIVVPEQSGARRARLAPGDLKPLTKNFIRRCALSWLFASTKLHELMLADQVRMDAYRRAIRGIVNPGDSVLDIGTGTGIMAFLAAQAGASNVLAIDKSRIISLAGELAKLNGLDDRVRFAQCDSMSLKPDTKFDVIISELLGTHVVNEGVLEVLADARTRLLKENGTMIPRSLEVFLVPVSAAHGLPSMAPKLDGLDFTPLKRRNAGTVHQVERVAPESCFLCEPKRIFEFDFMNTSHPGNADVSFNVTRDGTFVGFLCHFALHLAEDAVIDTSPAAAPTHWKNLFITGNVAEVGPGDTIAARLEIRRVPLASYRMDLVDHSVDSSK